MIDIYEELLNDFKEDKILQRAIQEKDAEAISKILQHRHNMQWHFLSFNETFITVAPYLEDRPERLHIVLDKELNINRIVRDKISYKNGGKTNVSY